MDPAIAEWLIITAPQYAPAGNRTRVCTVAGYYSTTRPLVLADGRFNYFINNQVASGHDFVYRLWKHCRHTIGASHA
ncbi:hypothetical protein Pint_10216 [Pistacia integerrima]|uniref:Uncharacterized protein n=1 Tax=Pistacia integerrima TaxID=434235 RepID=A0ACC0XJY7_9ROSI|nr:hypothetical protein Pint_10216 [Pistacia integerrima]